MHTLKVHEIVNNIYNRLKYAQSSESVGDGTNLWADELAELRSSYDQLCSISSSVGAMPPQPNTWRGRVGAQLVRIVQRMLFWYTPQVRRFNSSVAAVLKSICTLQELQLQWALQEQRRLNALKKELVALKLELEVRDRQQATSLTASSHSETSKRKRSDGIPSNQYLWEKFMFSLTGRFRGSEKDVSDKLCIYLDLIDNLDPSPPEGPWLDIGCGRGEWLRLSQGRPQEILGIDSSPFAVAYCRRQGFSAEQHDALVFLKGRPDHEFGMITAFHVIEHLPVDYTVGLIREAARTLKPGGLLIVELPHPGNLLVASDDFWLDPTHQRLVPPRLVDFLFHYCGLRVLKRLDLNPDSEDKHLPFTELEFVERIDHRFHGPRDYAIIGAANLTASSVQASEETRS